MSGEDPNIKLIQSVSEVQIGNERPKPWAIYPQQYDEEQKQRMELSRLHY